MSVLGSVDNAFAYRMLIFAMAILILMPTAITVFVGNTDGDGAAGDLMDDYYDFTGTRPTNEAVWALTGIYTPYGGGTSYGYTDDGWLYGSRIVNYTPAQYKGTTFQYTVSRDGSGLYRYSEDTINGDHSKGELYTAVAMSNDQKSSIFFTTGGKVEHGDFFYYNYNGYRYAFQPLADYTGIGTDGQQVPVVATTTSLSLIWYSYYGSSGISGQLIISGSDSGVAYLTSTDIIRAFDSSTSTSRFNMHFNGVDMNIHIRLNPYFVSQYSIQQCYELGYWEIMVTSLSTNIDSYVGTDNSFNPSEIMNTLIKLFTFRAEDLGMTGWIATVASIIISLPLYAALLSIGMSWYPAMILVGILAAIQSIGMRLPF